ncbi:iron-sulfur cluster assembly scaffold protein [Candidatus Gottesmanbacteria bacterium]|nr:iron-sulfur cluster assembly scaffold protein [Candidatus Gottesmanbacteria bacterium]
MDLYRENILDHYQNPRNFGKLPKPTTSAQVFNDFCGDFIHMDIKLKKPKSSTKINVEDVRRELSSLIPVELVSYGF